MSEEALKTGLRQALQSDFLIYEEVTGVNILTGKKVRADFVLKATDRLIVEQGFSPDWFAIEVKWVQGINHQTSKITKAVWQSITYAQSKFSIGDLQIIPAFVLLHTPNNLDRRIEEVLNHQLQLALYGRVGRVQLYKPYDWVIKFSQIYCCKGGRAKSSLIPKDRAGFIK